MLRENSAKTEYFLRRFGNVFMALDQRHIPQGARTLCYPLGGNRAATATTEDGQGNVNLMDLLGQLKDQNAQIIDQLTASQGDGNNGTVEKKKQVPKRVEVSYLQF